MPGGTVTHAHIRLEPKAGSVTLNANLGLMSLMAGSSAQGIGIQILGRDALTPITLEQAVHRVELFISNGETQRTLCGASNNSVCWRGLIITCIKFQHHASCSWNCALQYILFQGYRREPHRLQNY